LKLCFTRFPCIKDECNFWDENRGECVIKLAALSFLQPPQEIKTSPVNEEKPKKQEEKKPQRRQSSNK
jgi:hypothetical protein